jgi:hypothetical protein
MRVRGYKNNTYWFWIYFGGGAPDLRPGLHTTKTPYSPARPPVLFTAVAGEEGNCRGRDAVRVPSPSLTNQQ